MSEAIKVRVTFPSDKNRLGNTILFGSLLVILFAATILRTIGDGSAMFLVLIVCILAFVRLFGELNGRIRRSPLNLPLLAIALFALAQGFAVPGRATPVSLDPGATFRFACLLGGLILFQDGLAAYLGNESHIRKTVLFLIALALASAVYGLTIKWFLPLNFGWPGATGVSDQGYGQFANRNHFGFLMEAGLGLITGLIVLGRISRWQIFAALVAYGVIVLALIDAQSRGALVSWAAISLFGVLTFVVARERRRAPELNGGRPSLTKHLGTTAKAAAFCLLLVLGIATLIATVGGESIVGRFENVNRELEKKPATANINRRAIWSYTADLIRENPIAGVGFGAYPDAVTEFDRSSGKFDLEQAHNDYLELAASGGLIGVLLVVWFLVLAAREATVGLRQSAGFELGARTGAMLGLAGILVHSTVDFGLHIPVNAFTAFALIGIATTNSRILPPNSTRRSDWIRFAFIGSMIILIAAFAAKFGISDNFVARSIASRDAVDAERAIRFDSLNASAHQALAGILRANGQFEAAAIEYERSIELRRFDYRTRLDLGSIQKEIGNAALAERSFRDAVRLAPHYSRPNFVFGSVLVERGQYDDGFAHLRVAARGDDSLYPQLIESAARIASGDPDRIISFVGTAELVGRIKLAEYFVVNSILTEPVMALLTGDGLPNYEKEAIARRLLDNGKPAVARAVWLTTIDGRFAVDDGSVYDGGFEDDQINDRGLFGWDVTKMNGSVNVKFDANGAFQGNRSLFIRYSGHIAPDTDVISQRLLVTPRAKYRLSYVYNSTEMVSAALPQFVLRSGNGTELVRSAPLNGTRGQWVRGSVDFDSLETAFVIVGLRREHCDNNPCPVFGDLRLDAIELKKAGPR